MTDFYITDTGLKVSTLDELLYVYFKRHGHKKITRYDYELVKKVLTIGEKIESDKKARLNGENSNPCYVYIEQSIQRELKGPSRSFAKLNAETVVKNYIKVDPVRFKEIDKTWRRKEGFYAPLYLLDSDECCNYYNSFLTVVELSELQAHYRYLAFENIKYKKSWDSSLIGTVSLSTRLISDRLSRIPDPLSYLLLTLLNRDIESTELKLHIFLQEVSNKLKPAYLKNWLNDASVSSKEFYNNMCSVLAFKLLSEHYSLIECLDFFNEHYLTGRVSYESLVKYFNNLAEYKDLPVEWWAELV